MSGIDCPNTDVSGHPPDIVTSCQSNSSQHNLEELEETLIEEYVRCLELALSYNDRQAVEELFKTVLEDAAKGRNVVVSHDFIEVLLQSLDNFDADDGFMKLAMGVIECFIVDISRRLIDCVIDHRLISFFTDVLQGDLQVVQKQLLKVLLIIATSEKFASQVLSGNDYGVFFEIIQGIVKLLNRQVDEDWHRSILSLLQRFVKLDPAFGRMLIESEGHHTLAGLALSSHDTVGYGSSMAVEILHLYETLTVDVQHHTSMVICDICKVMVTALKTFAQNKEILQLCLHITHNLSALSEVAEYLCSSALLEVLNEHISQVFSNFGVQFLHEFDVFFTDYSQILSGLALYFKDDMAPQLVSTMHNIMCQFRDHVLIQNSAQQALVVIIHAKPHLLDNVNEGSFHIPLATVVLGTILTHGKRAQSFSTCCELLSCLCSSDEVREALGVRNTHIAIYTLLKHHKDDLVVSALGYKFLHKYCQRNAENVSKVTAFGFLNEMCDILHDMQISNRNIELFRHRLTLFKVTYSKAQDTFTKQERYCSLIQNILVDIYKSSESLALLCLECLNLVWECTQTNNAAELIALTLDCMDKYSNSKVIHQQSIRLLQLLSSLDLPQSVVLVCQQDLQIFKGETSVLEDILVLLYLMAKPSSVKANWMIASDILQDLIIMGSSNDVMSSSAQLVYGLLYVFIRHPTCKPAMLHRVCELGSLEGAVCMLSLGASPGSDFTEGSPLSLACKTGNLPLVSLILEHRMTDLKMPLKVALGLKHHQIAGVLLKQIWNFKEKDMVQFSGLGLGDLRAEWFEPLLECVEVIPDRQVLKKKWMGKYIADAIKKIGALIERHSSDGVQITQTPEDGISSPSEEKIPCATQPGRTSKFLRRSQSKTELHHGKTTGVRHVGNSLPREMGKGIFKNTVFNDENTFGYPMGNALHPDDPRHILHTGAGLGKFQLTGEEARKSAPHSVGRKIPVGFRRRFYRRSSVQSPALYHSPYPESESELDMTGSLSTDVAGSLGTDMAGSLSTDVAGSLGTDMAGSLSTDMARSLSTDMTGSPTADVAGLAAVPSHKPYDNTESGLVLKELDLSDNEIGEISGLLEMSAKGLHKLKALVRLMLAHNCITDIPHRFVQHVPQLNQLVLHHNVLQQFPVSVLQCPQLQTLDLSHNQLCDFTIPDHVEPVLTLTELNLSHNLLINLPVSLVKKLPKLQTLQLASNHVEELPGESVQLACLKTLDLSYNQLTSLGEEFCVQLHSVKTLLLQGNILGSLPSYETAIRLEKLEQLDLSHNTALCGGEEGVPYFIQALPKLSVLNLSATALKHFLKPQSLKSANLTHLNLSHNNLRNFYIGSDYSVYSKLKTLDLSHNDLVQLPAELGFLSALSSLHLSHNKRLSSLPVEMGCLTHLWELKLEGLKLDLDNSLLQGRTKDIIGYLNERYKKSVEYNQLKLMLVGYGGRGKTSLVQALMKESKSEPLPTVGINVKNWRLRESLSVSYTLSVWDFAGQEDFYCTHQCFMSDRALYLVVYNLGLPIHIEMASIKPWLQNIHARAPECPVIIVGTHYDKLSVQGRDEIIDDVRSRISEMCEQPGYPDIVAMIEVSCVSHSMRMQKLRDIIKDTLTGYKIRGQRVMGQKVPASYVRLQDLLMKELSHIQQSFPIITRKRLKQIVERGGLALDPEELNQAVRFLHHSGVILHYEDSTLKLNDFYFLSPEWLCRMMAQVVTVREINPCVSQYGVLRRQDLPLLFSGKKVVGEHRRYMFPPSLIPQYLQMLYKFDIALPLNDTELLIPARLPGKPVFVIPWSGVGLVRRVYTLEYIPAGLWSRLITRLLVFRTAMFGEENVTQSTRYWKEGVFVQSVMNSAFYVVESKGSSSIQISVPPSPPGVRLLGDVVYHLDLLIEEWYPGLLMLTPRGKKLLTVTIPCILCQEDMSFSFPLDYIIKLSAQSDTVRCPHHEDAIRIQLLAPDVMMADLDPKFHLDQSQLNFDESPDQILGEGTFGIVYRATYQHKPVAVKKYITSGDKPPYKNLRQEALILSKLVHASLIQLVAVEVKRSLLLLELAPSGSLRAHLSQDERVLSEALRHRMALQICEGLHHLHQKQIIYRDLKPDNILVFSLRTNTACNVKISDYGIAHLATQTGLLSCEGTPGYRAAEVIRGEPYSTKADMFSYGVTLYELVTCGIHPYGEVCEGFGYQLDNSIAAGIWPHPLSAYGVNWSIMQDVIDLCLAPVPDDRLDANAVVSLLNNPEALCRMDCLTLSKHMPVDAMIRVKESGSNEERHALVACGGVGYSQLTSVRLGAHCHIKGSLFTSGQVLSLLYVSSNLLLAGTKEGAVYSLNPETFQIREPAYFLSDSILCMIFIKCEEGESTVIIGTADGHVTLIASSHIRQDWGNTVPVELELGASFEAVTCLCRISRHYMYAAVASRLYRILLKPRVMAQMNYCCDLKDSTGSGGPVSHMVRHKSHIHVIKKWGHRLYRVSVRARPYVNNRLDTMKVLKRSGVDVRHSFDARLLSMILVEKTTLWITTANGCILTVNPDTYTPLTCLQNQGPSLRHMLGLPDAESGSCVVMSRSEGADNDTQNTSGDQFGELLVWRSDLPQQTQSFQEYSQQRESLSSPV